MSGTAGLLAVTLPHRALAALATDDPASIITGIYTRAAQGKGDAGGNFVVGNKVARSKYLSKSLAALWAKADARTRKGEAGPIDFDPVTNSQDPDVKSFKVTAEKQEGDKATIAVTIEGHQGPRPKPSTRPCAIISSGRTASGRSTTSKAALTEGHGPIRSILAASLKS